MGFEERRERGKENQQRPKTAWSTLQALGLAGGIAAAGMGTQHMKWQNTLDAINQRVLTPSAVRDIRQQTNATDEEMDTIEQAVENLLRIHM